MGSIILFVQRQLSASLVSPVTISPTLKPLPTVSLESIYLNSHSIIDLPPDHIRTIIASGDIIPARSVNYQSVKHHDFTWAFKNIIPLLSNADLTFINLETPLIKNCPVTVDGMIFCGDSRNIEGLKTAGVDVVSFANNHIGNYGVNGITETKQLLEQNNIEVTGISGPVIKDVRGLKIAFLAYNEIGVKEEMVSWLDEDVMTKEITEAKKGADLVLAAMSWGVEYTEKPTGRQREIAKKAIDAGADLIIGNHPHWLQGVEFYKGKLITYAHGNTIFDQMWSEETKTGVIGKYTFYDKQLVDVEYFPVYIKNYGQPILLEGDAKRKVLDTMLNRSKLL